MKNKMTMIVSRSLSIKSEDVEKLEDPDFLTKKSKKRKAKIIICLIFLLILTILVVLIFLIFKQ
jgi:hypothetical protein